MKNFYKGKSYIFKTQAETKFCSYWYTNKIKNKLKLTETNLPRVVRLPSSVSEFAGESSGEGTGFSLDLSGQGAPTPIRIPSLRSEKYNEIYVTGMQKLIVSMTGIWTRNLDTLLGSGKKCGCRCIKIQIIGTTS